MLVIFNKVKILKNWNSMYADYLHALLSACFIFCVLYCLRALFFSCLIISLCFIMRVCFAPVWCPPPCFCSCTVFLYGFAPMLIFAFFVRVCSCALIGYPHMPPICKNLMIFRLCCPCVINLSSAILHHAILLKFYWFWVSEVFTVSTFYFTFLYLLFVFYFLIFSTSPIFSIRVGCERCYIICSKS